MSLQSQQITAEEIRANDVFAVGIGSMVASPVGAIYSALWGISEISGEPVFSINPSAYAFGVAASAATLIVGGIIVNRVSSKIVNSQTAHLYSPKRGIKAYKAGFHAAAAATLLAVGSYAYFHPMTSAPDVGNVAQSAAAPRLG